MPLQPILPQCSCETTVFSTPCAKLHLLLTCSNCGNLLNYPPSEQVVFLLFF